MSSKALKLVGFATIACIANACSESGSTSRQLVDDIKFVAPSPDGKYLALAYVYAIRLNSGFYQLEYVVDILEPDSVWTAKFLTPSEVTASDTSGLSPMTIEELPDGSLELMTRVRSFWLGSDRVVEVVTPRDAFVRASWTSNNSDSLHVEFRDANVGIGIDDLLPVFRPKVEVGS